MSKPIDDDVSIIWAELSRRKLLRGVWRKFENAPEDVQDDFRQGICEAIKTINFRDQGQTSEAIQ